MCTGLAAGRPLVLASLLSSLAATAVAQAPPAPAPAAEPVFRAGTTAVLLDVVVRDRRGRPVRDLRPDEVTVLEDGVARQVHSFRLVEGGTAVGAAPADAASAATLPGAGRPDGPRRVTLISLVFDHLGQNARQLALKAAQDYLATPLPATHWVAVFSLDQRLRMRQGFTQDTSAIAAAVVRATSSVVKEDAPMLPGASRERAADTAFAKVGDGDVSATERSTIASDNADPQVRETILRMQALASTIDASQRGHATFYPLMELARAQAALEGRKAILLFSEGLQVPSSVEESFRTAISEANRANVSIYAVDARGLDAARDLQTAAAALEKASRLSQQAIGQSGADATSIDEMLNDDRVVASLRSSTQSVLRELAESTGGALVANSNDLGKGLARVGADLASYYEIAYVPQSGAADGRFRAIDVKVARKGVDVSSRSGYFALPAADRAPVLPYELALLAAAAATPMPRAFEFQAGAFRFHETPRGRQFTLVAEVPIAALTVAEDAKAGRYRLRIDVMALVKDAGGAVIERLSHAYPLEGPLADLPALRRGHVVFKRQLWLAAGRYTLTTVVRDRQADTISARVLPLRVFPESPGIDVSTVAVVKRLDKTAGEPDAVEDPFRNGPVRIAPSLATPIPKAANSRISAFVVLYPDTAMIDPPSLTIEFAQGAAIVGRSAPALDQPDADGRITCVATFPVDGFAPGTYELRAIARQGASQDESRTTFTIVQ